jgi:hypothetical protein
MCFLFNLLIFQKWQILAGKKKHFNPPKNRFFSKVSQNRKKIARRKKSVIVDIIQKQYHPLLMSSQKN